VIAVDRDLVEQVGGDDPALPLVGLLPDLVDVVVRLPTREGPEGNGADTLRR